MKGTYEIVAATGALAGTKGAGTYTGHFTAGQVPGELGRHELGRPSHELICIGDRGLVAAVPCIFSFLMARLSDPSGPILPFRLGSACAGL